MAVNPGAYAIVGMAAVFAGAARAPITAILIVFEMSGDYKLILPLMLATVIATIVAERIFPESIYTFKLKLKGITLERGRDVDILQSVTVDEVMTALGADRPRDDDAGRSLRPLCCRATATASPCSTPTAGSAASSPSPTSTGPWATNCRGAPPPREIGTPRAQLLVATPDQPVGEVLRRIGTRGLGRMPVVETNDPDRLIGMVRRSDIIRAYDLAVSRRAELQHRARRVQLRNLDGTEFVDIVLETGDFAVARRLVDVASLIPDDCILVSIRRAGRIVIPHGDTVFRPGDTVTAFVRREDIDRIQTSLRTG